MHWLEQSLTALGACLLYGGCPGACSGDAYLSACQEITASFEPLVGEMV